MNLLLNILWLVFGGFVSALSWMFAALILLFTIIGIPWVKSTFNIGLLTLWPFGTKVTKSNSPQDLGAGSLGFIGNIIWFIFAGWWLFLSHLAAAIIMAITIIGLPFAIQYWKLAKLSLAPIGKNIDSDLI